MRIALALLLAMALGHGLNAEGKTKPLSPAEKAKIERLTGLKSSAVVDDMIRVRAGRTDLLVDITGREVPLYADSAVSATFWRSKKYGPQMKATTIHYPDELPTQLAEVAAAGLDLKSLKASVTGVKHYVLFFGGSAPFEKLAAPVRAAALALKGVEGRSHPARPEAAIAPTSNLAVERLAPFTKVIPTASDGHLQAGRYRSVRFRKPKEDEGGRGLDLAAELRGTMDAARIMVKATLIPGEFAKIYPVLAGAGILPERATYSKGGLYPWEYEIEFEGVGKAEDLAGAFQKALDLLPLNQDVERVEFEF